jgi:DNA repair exonuclease SbcCD ATPase subunit
MKAEEDLQALERRVEELEERVEKDVEDVRERVVQVKREADKKAPTDHDHDELAERVEDLAAEISATAEALEQTESRLDGGFENFEEILERLLDRTDALEDDVDTIGAALRSMRSTLDTVAERERRRARADHLKTTAAERGVRTAKCEDCSTTVDVAMLSEPACPTCGADFHSLDANPGFFGTSILETGRRPALEGDGPSGRPDLSAVGDGSADEQADSAFDWQSSDNGGSE